MTGIREDVETKNSCWARKLITIQTKILPHGRIIELTVPWKIQIKVWHTFLSYFLQEVDPLQMKTPDHKNIDPRLVEIRRLMKLETSPWWQPIWELHKLITPEHYKVLTTPSKVGHTVLRALAHCGPLCLAKQ